MIDHKSPNDLSQSKVHFNLKQNTYDNETKSYNFDSKEGSARTESRRLSSRLSLSQSQKLDAIIPAGEEVHEVKLVVNILASFPVDSALSETSKSRLLEGPKPINFYRFEYQLVPDDNESLVSADVVVYKSSIKLFPEKFEPRVIKGWILNNKLWVAWSQSHELKMSKTRLIKLFDYELVLKIWDNKEFCSPRTRFDKPRSFKYSNAGEQSDEEEMKSHVLKLCENYLKQIPVELHEKQARKLPNQSKFECT